jgi:hypothetical protein
MRNGETVLQLENLRPEWLPTRTQRLLSKAGTVFASGLAGGPLLGLSHGLIAWFIITLLTVRHTNLTRMSSLLFVTASSGLEWGLTWLSLALCFGLAGTFLQLRPTETIRTTVVDVSSRLGRPFRAGLLPGGDRLVGALPVSASVLRERKQMMEYPGVRELMAVGTFPPAFCGSGLRRLSSD